jgi:hypothetical protein
MLFRLEIGSNVLEKKEDSGEMSSSQETIDTQDDKAQRTGDAKGGRICIQIEFYLSIHGHPSLLPGKLILARFHVILSPSRPP